jgi:hypothetical protein
LHREVGLGLSGSEFGEHHFRAIVTSDRKDNTIPRGCFDESIGPANGSKPVREMTTEDVRAIIWRKSD